MGGEAEKQGAEEFFEDLAPEASPRRRLTRRDTEDTCRNPAPSRPKPRPLPLATLQAAELEALSV